MYGIKIKIQIPERQYVELNKALDQRYSDEERKIEFFMLISS
jgi:hypothetical protein